MFDSALSSSGGPGPGLAVSGLVHALLVFLLALPVSMSNRPPAPQNQRVVPLVAAPAGTVRLSLVRASQARRGSTIAASGMKTSPAPSPARAFAPPPRPALRSATPAPPALIPGENPRLLPEATSPQPLEPLVKTGVFSQPALLATSRSGLSAGIQVGGFAASTNGTSAALQAVGAAKVGGFSTVSADTGAGLPRAVPGPAPGAGFGEAAAARASAARPEIEIRQGAFGDVRVERFDQTRRKPDSSEDSSSAVEILFKPRPVYTEEARRLQLEGEVLLQALFTRTGRVEVCCVLKSLGHGLDENAVQAAQEIRFKPARRNGEAIDAAATVYITFQLAY